MRWCYWVCLTWLAGCVGAAAQVKDDGSPHKVQKVAVGGEVSLEVLDWGGQGRAVVLLPELSVTAHSYDRFAPKLTDVGHIYAITRRGSGDSSKPKPPAFDVKATSYSLVAQRRDPKEPNPYDADRLGDDVIAVIDALKLDRPVLVGQAIAGEELSSVGTRYPKKIGGLVYLDALGEYAYFTGPEDKMMFRGPHPWAIGFDRPSDTVLAAMFGRKKFAAPSVPTMVILGYPRALPQRSRNDMDDRNAFYKAEAESAARLDSFVKADKGTRIVRIANADRDLLGPHEAEVLAAVKAFLAGLK
jgi:pimeloyl-ACP methyl ester carboxylesterase